jgi:hypothetical protein
MPESERVILALSSDGVSTYEVHFTLRNHKVIVDCSCPAGELGKLCRHKIALLNGDTNILFDPSEEDALKAVQLWIQRTGYPKLLKEIEEAEKAVKTSQKRLIELKSNLEKAMNHGL